MLNLHEYKASIAKEVARATAAEEALAARLKTAEDALAAVNDAIAKKADLKDLQDLQGKMEAVETNLSSALSNIKDLQDANVKEQTERIAAVNDLQQQIDALKAYETRIKDLETKYAAMSGVAGVTMDAFTKLQEQVENLKSSVDTNSTNVETLQKDLQSLANQVAKFQSEIDVLNVLVANSLRSLTFIPDSYYWGVEATELFYLEGDQYKLATTAWDKTEEKGYDDDTRYETSDFTKVLTFAAKYNMNPSSAEIAKEGAVSLLSGDLKYENTRAAEAGLSVKSYSVANGDLTVNIDVKDPSKIKSVLNDKMITNFAAVVKSNKQAGTPDTTVTSDYATLYKTSVKDLKLAHELNTTENPIPLYANAPKSALKPYSGTDVYAYLMQTAHEAKTLLAQDSVVYNDNEGIDLRKLVATVYTDQKGETKKLADATVSANLKYVFELTGLYIGDNKTDESAHAAIASDGYTFRPQMPSKDGKQQAYGATQDRQEIGRTPLVRVSLVDSETGAVYDYGYIRIKIVDKAATVKPDQAITYTGKGYTYNGECEALGWSYETTWNVTEYDLYNKLGLTREEFEANYGAPVGNAEDLTQFVQDKNGKFVEATEKLGTASTRTDVATEDGARTSILKWEMTGEQAYKYFVTDKKKGTGIAIKYESKDKTVGPDVYVEFKTGSDVTINVPSAVVDWDSQKNVNYWAATNAATMETGLDEIHVNVPSVEDERYSTAEPFEKIFADVFKGNKINTATILKSINDKTANKEYAADKLNFDLIFDKTNVDKKFNGVDGKVYVLSVTTDGKTLQANEVGKTAKQDVAKIEGTELNAEKVVYQHTAFAEALLNYKAHNALDNNTLTAVVGLVAKNKGCAKELKLTNNTFNVRFLRPLNISNTEATVTDAATTEKQVIKLIDLLKFSDWREAWKAENYPTFYGIEGVTVEGVADGELISTNANVTTDQSNGDINKTSLASVNKAVDFKYNSADKGTLTYVNNSAAVSTFKVRVPVIVKYIWGSVPQTITITVNSTVNNAKRH
jgi:predicted  nucleic acid-binding Zn-ribbon protein